MASITHVLSIKRSINATANGIERLYSYEFVRNNGSKLDYLKLEFISCPNYTIIRKEHRLYSLPRYEQVLINNSYITEDTFNNQVALWNNLPFDDCTLKVNRNRSIETRYSYKGE